MQSKISSQDAGKTEANLVDVFEALKGSLLKEPEKSKVNLADVLVALRDSLLKTVDTINAYLETQVPPVVDVEELKQKIPEELHGLLTFDVKEGHCVITPRTYLGGEVFAKVANIIRMHNGRYISQGKESHFIVPIKTG